MTDPCARRFLITHTMVRQIMGSTVALLELADHLRSRGGEVLVHACDAGPPMADLFAERGIPVITDDDPDLRLADFDYIWVHSQLLPPAFVREMTTEWPADPPAFIFNHMSALAAAPDEHPFVHQLDERLAAVSLFVSEQTRELLLPFYSNPPPTGLYPNPAPEEFCDLDRTHREQPRRVLIVSNHPPAELLEAAELLRGAGCEVVHVGDGAQHYELVTPDTLARYDVVISIGKTVQYCLVSGTPVFVYDHFGGFGYLDEANLEHAAHHNFSGRGGAGIEAPAIRDMVLAGYTDAVSFHVQRRDEFIARYSIAAVVEQVLRSAVPRTLERFDTAYARATASTLSLSRRGFRTWGELIGAIERIQAQEAELAALRAAQTELWREREDILASHSFRLGYRMLSPLRQLRGDQP